MKLRYIMFFAGVVMSVLAIFAPCLVERPKDLGPIGTREHSITTSGLPPKADWLLQKGIMAILASICALFFYARKLDKSLSCEKDVLRLRRCLSIYHYLLLAGVLLAGAEITFALFGLSTVRHVRLAHISYSTLLLGLMSLFFIISWFCFTRKYIKAIQTAPASVILAAKSKAPSA